MTTKQIISITYLRAIAVCLIFICHICYISHHFPLSMWFNTGVPLFFIISAYLMSMKSFDMERSVSHFYKKRAMSILVPYEIYLLFIIVITSVAGRGPSMKGVIMYITALSGFTNGGVLGMGHLWFITVLFICYSITPLLYIVYSMESPRKKYIILLGLICQFLFFLLCGFPAYGIHVGSYCLVYLFFLNNQRRITFKVLTAWGITAIFLSIIRLFLDSPIMAGDYTIYYYYDALFQPIARFSIAMTMFCSFICCDASFVKWGNKHTKIDSVIKWFSGISYEFYLTHQFIMLAIWEFFPQVHDNIGLLVWITSSFILTLVNAELLNLVCTRVIKQFK